MIVEIFSCWVITVQGGGVTTCKFDRVLPLFLLYLPITIRSRNEGIRSSFFSPLVFKKYNNEYEYFSIKGHIKPFEGPAGSDGLTNYPARHAVAAMRHRPRYRLRQDSPWCHPICSYTGGPFENIKGPLENIQAPFENIQGPLENIQGPFEKIQGPLENIQWPFENVQEPLRTCRCP